YGVHPEFECFDLGMINFGKYLIQKGLAGPPYYWNVLLGNIAGLQATPSQIGAALNEIPSNHYVALAGLGKSQLPVAGMAISQGLGVRIGIEDNIWWDQKRTRYARNIELLRRVHQLMDIHEQSLIPSGKLGELGFYNTQRIKVNM
ncbi:MAG: 3-keto-5-aminohexanoate cleavage protein, partial [Bacteroidia bacterium]|nr:3-keto-5-aminohexanoate cleavage protein [Bacteroidia bacterium]